MEIRQTIVAVVFAIWLVASALVYLPGLKPFIRRWDIFALVPQWNFFAPRPAQNDYLLLYRDQLPDGHVTRWIQVSSIPERSSWCILWNPSKRSNKALFDAVTDLGQNHKASVKGLELSVPYLAILTHVCSMPRFGPARRTQFLLMRSARTRIAEDYEVLFLSQFHSL